MKKILATILAVAMLATTFVGCGGTPDAGQTDENVITACIGPEPETLDPALNKSVDGACYAVHAFEGIYKFDENGNTILGQAEKVDVSDDEMCIRDRQYCSGTGFRYDCPGRTHIPCSWH